MLVVAAINVTNGSFAIDDQGCRVRNIERVHANQVIQPVTLGNHSVLVQKKGERDWVFLQKLARLEEAVPLFRRNEGQLRTGLGNLVLDRLGPSHALDAIGSPGTPQELRNQQTAPQKSRQRQHPLAIGGFPRKTRSTGA